MSVKAGQAQPLWFGFVVVGGFAVVGGLVVVGVLRSGNRRWLYLGNELLSRTDA
jgi:hypothetical protein